ncbi:MAG: uracil-DNA glycosylase [Pseudomonadota bacterium]
MSDAAISADAPKNCRRCPRLVAFRARNTKQEADWFNGAVPSFGDRSASLLIVGLAPGLRGANRTGRPFTGDSSGEVLFRMLDKFGFTQGEFANLADDGLTMVDAMITNAVRCVPPQNRPIGSEVTACRSYLTAQIDVLPSLKLILALGKIAHDSSVKALGLKLKDHPFGHAKAYHIECHGRPISLLSSYHCSRYNLNTGRLTEKMFEEIFQTARRILAKDTNSLQD